MAQDPRYSETHSLTIAIKESLDSKLRDRDVQTISRSDAVLRRMHRLNLLGQTETMLDDVLLDALQQRLQSDACRPESSS